MFNYQRWAFLHLQLAVVAVVFLAHDSDKTVVAAQIFKAETQTTTQTSSQTLVPILFTCMMCFKCRNSIFHRPEILFFFLLLFLVCFVTQKWFSVLRFFRLHQHSSGPWGGSSPQWLSPHLSVYTWHYLFLLKKVTGMVFNLSARLISMEPSLMHLSNAETWKEKKIKEGNSSFAIRGP